MAYLEQIYCNISKDWHRKLYDHSLQSRLPREYINGRQSLLLYFLTPVGWRKGSVHEISDTSVMILTQRGYEAFDVENIGCVTLQPTPMDSEASDATAIDKDILECFAEILRMDIKIYNPTNPIY